MPRVSCRRPWLAWLLTALMLSLAAPALANQTVTDQLGRQVEVPDQAKRIVVLMHHALDMLIQLGAQDQIVGVLDSWEKNIPDAAQTMPALAQMPTPGDLRAVNMESLLALQPDLVIVTHYAPQAMLDQITQAGIPVIGVSMYAADREQASVLNPKLKNPDEAYTVGVRDAIMLMGQVSGHVDRAKRLWEVVEKNRALIAGRLGDIPREQRVTTYMAYPKLHTMGSGRYAALVMERSGGRNVAELIDGYKPVTMEQVLAWDPQVIFVQDRYKDMVAEMNQDPAWAPISAIKNHRVYLCPQYVKPWGHPVPESMALGELWMASKLYPDQFKDIDLPKLVDEFYREFYGITYAGGH